MIKVLSILLGLSLMASSTVFAKEGDDCSRGRQCPRGELCDPFDNKCRIGPKLKEIQTFGGIACASTDNAIFAASAKSKL